MTKWFTRPDSFDARWIKFVEGKFWETKPDTSHHIAFQMGYLSGRENQKYLDLRTIVEVLACLPHSDNQFIKQARAEYLYAILEVMKSQKVVDKYTTGLTA